MSTKKLTVATSRDAEDYANKAISGSYSDLWSRPGYLVRRLHQIHVGIFANEFDDMDLTPIQYAMLSVLSSGKEFDQLTLSTAIGIDRTSGADVIKRLARRGLLDRVPSEVDRRAKVIRITDEGKALVERMHPAMERAQDRFLGPLTERERKEFFRLLRKLVISNNDASRAPLA
ncbi:MAG: MarR family winged helix-turn-helix transcriptional regulator [Pseudomonadota bacterium]